jgi:hypothetical protein
MDEGVDGTAGPAPRRKSGRPHRGKPAKPARNKSENRKFRPKKH